MKALITLVLLSISYFSSGQFERKWYTFQIEDMSYNTIIKDKLIIGRIASYHTPKEYLARVDTFTIENQFLKNDSTLYIVTNRQPDNLKFDLKKLNIHKFIYDKNSNTITSFFYQTIKGFYELQTGTEKLQKKDVQEFINADTSKIGYLTYYSKDTIDAFLAYPKLIDQPVDKVIMLYNNLASIYSEFNTKTDEDKMPYALLRGMSKSAIEVPAYIDLKICPLVQAENFDEIDIREKYKTNKEVIKALDKFRVSR